MCVWCDPVACPLLLSSLKFCNRYIGWCEVAEWPGINQRLLPWPRDKRSQIWRTHTSEAVSNEVVIHCVCARDDLLYGKLMKMEDDQMRRNLGSWEMHGFCGEVQTVGTLSLASNRITALIAANKHVLTVSYVCDTVMLRWDPFAGKSFKDSFLSSRKYVRPFLSQRRTRYLRLMPEAELESNMIKSNHAIMSSIYWKMKYVPDVALMA